MRWRSHHHGVCAGAARGAEIRARTMMSSCVRRVVVAGAAGGCVRLGRAACVCMCRISASGVSVVAFLSRCGALEIELSCVETCGRAAVLSYSCSVEMLFLYLVFSRGSVTVCPRRLPARFGLTPSRSGSRRAVTHWANSRPRPV